MKIQFWSNESKIAELLDLSQSCCRGDEIRSSFPAESLDTWVRRIDERRPRFERRIDLKQILLQNIMQNNDLSVKLKLLYIVIETIILFE